MVVPVTVVEKVEVVVVVVVVVVTVELLDVISVVLRVVVVGKSQIQSYICAGSVCISNIAVVVVTGVVGHSAVTRSDSLSLIHI